MVAESRAERVLAALQRAATGGLVCELPSAIARQLGISSDTVQRAIADLVAAGLLEPTPMRAGKARAYRLLDESPTVAAIDSHRRGAPVGGDSSAVVPLRRTSTAAHGVSPMDDEDRRWFDEFELTEDVRRDYADRARGVAVRLAGFGRERGEAAGDGVCDECERDVFAREWYGCFALCVDCASNRHSVRLKVAA